MRKYSLGSIIIIKILFRVSRGTWVIKTILGHLTVSKIWLINKKSYEIRKYSSGPIFIIRFLFGVSGSLVSIKSILGHLTVSKVWLINQKSYEVRNCLSGIIIIIRFLFKVSRCKRFSRYTCFSGKNWHKNMLLSRSSNFWLLLRLSWPRLYSDRTVLPLIWKLRNWIYQKRGWFWFCN